MVHSAALRTGPFSHAMTSSRTDVPPRCPLCRGGSRLWSRPGPRELWRCRDCQFGWVPQGVALTEAGVSIYEDEAPFFLSADNADYYQDESAVDAARAKVDWVAGLVRNGSPVLDVGANVGFFVREAGSRFAAMGIEPSAAAVQWGRDHLQADLRVGSVGVNDQAFAARYAAVTVFDVIEHLADPRAAIERCRTYLQPGGHLFLTTPDAGSLVARLLGSHWYYVDLIQHISLFTAANLTRLLHDAGFRVVDRRTMGRRYRFSYIARRLRELRTDRPVLGAAAAAAALLRPWPESRIALNLGDVMGLAAVRTE